MGQIWIQPKFSMKSLEMYAKGTDGHRCLWGTAVSVRQSLQCVHLNDYFKTLFLLRPPVSRYCASVCQLDTCAPAKLPQGLSSRHTYSSHSYLQSTVTLCLFLSFWLTPNTLSLVSSNVGHLATFLKVRSSQKLVVSTCACNCKYLTKSGLSFQTKDSPVVVHPSYMLRLLLRLIISKPPTKMQCNV